jgi:hypothetical protein
MRNGKRKQVIMAGSHGNDIDALVGVNESKSDSNMGRSTSSSVVN